MNINVARMMYEYVEQIADGVFIYKDARQPYAGLIHSGGKVVTPCTINQYSVKIIDTNIFQYKDLDDYVCICKVVKGEVKIIYREQGNIRALYKIGNGVVVSRDDGVIFMSLGGRIYTDKLYLNIVEFKGTDFIIGVNFLKMVDHRIHRSFDLLNKSGKLMSEELTSFESIDKNLHISINTLYSRNLKTIALDKKLGNGVVSAHYYV